MNTNNTAQPNSTHTNSPLLFVTVKKPDQIMFNGYAKAVTSYNVRGVFDILGYHTNFITLIEKSLIIHRDKQQNLTIPVEIGILKVYENKIDILIGIKTVAEK